MFASLLGRAVNWCLKRLFRIKLVRHTASTSSELRLRRLIRAEQIDLVVDVGANAGQFASDLRRNGYDGTIVSFEPLSTAYEQLVRKAAKDPRWLVAPRVAVGAGRAETQIHIAGNSVSSSLRPMLESHRIAAPGSDTVATEPVHVHPLDDFANSLLAKRSNLLIKIDTQGFEREVLVGAASTLERARIVQIELSTVSLYDGQALLPEMVHEMTKRGFALHSLDPMFIDDRDGRALQFDGIFVRQPSIDSECSQARSASEIRAACSENGT